MGGKPPEVTDDELVDAVQQLCEENDAPVVPTQEVAELEKITIQRQSVHPRLKSLHKEGRVGCVAVGERWSVWWVPEDEEANTDIDFNSINWEKIDPEEIPVEKIRARPEFKEPTYWEAWEEKANTIFTGVLLALGVGVLVYITRDWNLPWIAAEQEELIETLGALTIVGGLVFGVIGGVMVGTSKVGQFLVDRDADEALSVAWSRARGWVSQKSGYRIVQVDEVDENE